MGNHTEAAILKTFTKFLHPNPFLVKVYLAVAKATWAQTARYRLICTHLVELTLLEQALYHLVLIRKEAMRILEDLEERKKANSKIFIPVWNNRKTGKEQTINRDQFKPKAAKYKGQMKVEKESHRKRSTLRLEINGFCDILWKFCESAGKKKVIKHLKQNKSFFPLGRSSAI